MDIKTETKITQHSKLIGCSIHGHIRVSSIALKIIDTPEFQRLRDIKQLGLCHYVFPAAVHTRFQHSIGVYYLAGKMVEKIQKNYPDRIYNIPELGETKLTDFIGELIKIGGLCHDIGHSAFSHMFDDIMMTMTEHKNAEHEIRSCLIIDLICKKYLSTELNESHIKFIQSIVNPESHHIGAIYQIVSNYLNGIDVDKFDYLDRDSKALGMYKGFDSRRIIDEIVIDNHGNIAYPKHCANEIYDLFHTRYMMHKLVYNHKTTKIIESMIYDILKKIEPIFHLTDYIYNMEKFCKLNDNSIFFMLDFVVNPPPYSASQLSKSDLDIIKNAYDIYCNILNRKLYKCISHVISAPGNSDCLKNSLGLVSYETEPVTYLNRFIEYLKSENIPTINLEIINAKIGFVSGNKKNPFDSIFFYDKKEPDSEKNITVPSFILNKNQISIMLENDYVEKHHFLICKNRSEYPSIKLLYEQYTLL